MTVQLSVIVYKEGCDNKYTFCIKFQNVRYICNLHKITFIYKGSGNKEHELKMFKIKLI